MGLDQRLPNGKKFLTEKVWPRKAWWFAGCVVSRSRSVFGDQLEVATQLILVRLIWRATEHLGRDEVTLIGAVHSGF